NFHAMMRLDANRAKAILAEKAAVHSSSVTCMTIWGNHSSTQVPDFTNARIKGKKATDVVLDTHWLQEDFMLKVQKRDAEIMKARGKSSAASAASCALDAMRALFQPTHQNDWFASAVVTDEQSYGLDENLIFGLPCRSKGDGDYEIVSDLSW